MLFDKKMPSLQDKQILEAEEADAQEAKANKKKEVVVETSNKKKDKKKKDEKTKK